MSDFGLALYENFDMFHESLVRFTEIGYVMPPAATAVLGMMASTPDPGVLRDQALGEARAALEAGDAAAFAAAHARVMQQTVLVALMGNYREMQQALENDAARIVRDAMIDDAWRFTRTRYNDAGKRFAQAVRTCGDPDTRDSEMWDASKAAKDAWKAVPDLAAELDHLAGLLRFILVDLRGYRGGILDKKNPGVEAGYLVKMTDAHPRHVSEALAQPSDRRGGRWTEVVRLGATIATCDEVSDFAPVSLAELVVAERDRQGRPTVTLDPLDGEAAQSAIAELERTRKTNVIGGVPASARRAR
jgi:hypothetical protein